jgi:heme exporter protein A
MVAIIPSNLFIRPIREPILTTPLLELQEFSCERDERLLFEHLNLQCHPGDLVQITGPNGSGKTTLLRCLTGISSDYCGQILWRGRPLAEAGSSFQQSLLFIGHLPGVKKALTSRENLRWYAALSGVQASGIDAALEATGLRGYGDTPCYQLSAGQLRRVALARLYLSSAPLWILDEPFTAIDQHGIAQLETLFEQHGERGGVVLLTSHQDLGLPHLRRVNLEAYQPADEVLYDE